MILCIIFTSLFVISLILLFLYSLTDGDDTKTFVAIIILHIVSGVCMVSSAVLLTRKAIEYPASEYDFKIKVVEFEEHRDTILVVTPKDKIK